MTPSLSKNGQKLPTILNNIPNSLALQFGENFMKIGPKNSKVTDVYVHTDAPYIFTIYTGAIPFKVNALTLIFIIVLDRIFGACTDPESFLSEELKLN